MPHRKTIDSAGFSLIQMAMLVAVAGIIMVSILPGGRNGNEAEKQAITLAHMAAIEKATQSFMTTNLRRPCPADGSLANTAANFGLEASYPGACTGGTIGVNFAGTQIINTTLTNGSKTATPATLTGIDVGSYLTGTGIPTNTFVTSIDAAAGTITFDKAATAGGVQSIRYANVAAGTVPIKTLGLPEEYGLDGYGRRITYIVDKRATRAYSTSDVTGGTTPALTTSAKACFDLQSQGLTGSVKVYGSASDTIVKDNTMWALISYGKSGHGAFPANGSSVANRIDVSDTDATIVPDANQINAFVDPATVFTTQFYGKVIQQDPVEASDYNTTVWYSQDTKNTCCVGKMCNLGFDIKPGVVLGTQNLTTGVNLATGDFNGDGITDLAVAMNEYGPAGSVTTNRVYVIFGRKTGWPIPLGTANVITDIDSMTDGTYGFSLRNNAGTIANFANSIAMGDVNRDGFDDLIVGGNNITIVFGEANLGRNSVRADQFTGVDNNANTTTQSLYGMQISYNVTGTPQAVATADIQGLGGKSIILSGGSTSNVVWVVLDNTNINTYGAVGPPKLWNINANANATRSFAFTSITDNANYPLGHGMFSIAGGDINGDGKDDIVIGDSTATGGAGKVYALLTPVAGYVPSATTPPVLNLTTTLAFADDTHSYITAAGETGLGGTVAVADMNNDGYKDIITASTHTLFIYYGRQTTDWNQNTTAGVNDVTIDTFTDRPNWILGTLPRVIKTGDINNDGKQDLLFGTYESSAPSGCGKGVNAGVVYAFLQPPTGYRTGGFPFFDDPATTACDTNEMNLTLFAIGGYVDCATTPSRCAFRIDGGAAGHYAYIPAVGDLNADGKNEIFIAAPGYSTGGYGIAYTLWGHKTVPWDDVVNLGTITSP